MTGPSQAGHHPECGWLGHVCQSTEHPGWTEGKENLARGHGPDPCGDPRVRA